jgi:hypothetical protein
VTSVRVESVHANRAGRRDRTRGLLAFVQFEVNGLRVDGATVRRTRGGRLVLSYPCRLDRWGQEHPFVLPVDERCRDEIERAVLAQLKYLEAPR